MGESGCVCERLGVWASGRLGRLVKLLRAREEKWMMDDGGGPQGSMALARGSYAHLPTFLLTSVHTHLVNSTTIYLLK